MKLFTAIAVCFLSSSLLAQSISVTVREKGTGVPLKRVEAKHDGKTTYSNKDGVVSIDASDTSKTVTFYKGGFEKFITALANLEDLSPIEIFLVPSQPSDDEIIVSGVKRPEVSKKKISIEEAIKVAPRGDPVQVIKLLPGVQSAQFGSEIIIRGSGPEDTRYYIEEWSVPYIFHSIGGISIVPPQILSDVEFSSGGFGAQYGDATGGIVSLRTKNEVPDRDKLDLRMNIPLYSSIFYQKPFGKENDKYIAISGRRSYLDFFLNMVLKDNEQDLTLVPFFGDTQALYYNAEDDGHWKALFFTSFDGLKLASDFEQSNNEDGRGQFFLEQSIFTLGVERMKRLNKDWRLSTAFQASNYVDTFEVLDLFFRSKQNRLRNRSEFTLRRGKKEKTYIGAELTHLAFNVAVRLPQPDLNDPFFDFEEAPVKETNVTGKDTRADTWVTHELYFDPVQIIPGLRLYYDKLIDKFSLDPRLAFRYELNKENTLKLAMGQYSQLPNYRDTSQAFGNPDLDYILSNQYILGIETEWSDKWSTDFQIFYKKRYRLVRTDPETQTNNDGSGWNYGFEAFIRRNLTKRFFSWVSYTYSVSKDRDSDENTFHTSQYDQTHNINAVANYKLSAFWEIGGRFNYHTGATYNSVDDAVYNANLDKYQQRRFAESQPNNKRLPAYHEASIFAGRNYLWDTWKLEMRFGVEFLGLERQAQDVQYNYDYSKEEYFRGVPPIPYFELGAIF